MTADKKERKTNRQRMRREKDRQKKAEKDRKTSEIWKGERQIKN